MPYFPKNRVLFIHIPKTGGSSVEYSFLERGDCRDLYTPHSSNTIIPHEQFRKISLQHQFYSTLKRFHKECKINFNNELNIISIVRNPYHKVMSDLFFFKLINENSTPELVNKILKKFFKLKPSQCDNHNVPQYLFLIDDQGKIPEDINIFNTETLNDDLRKNNLPITSHKHLENPISKDYMEFLNDASLSLINERYQKDFELFEYVRYTSFNKIDERDYVKLPKFYKNKPCKSNGCPYVANVNINFFRQKSPEYFGYCCQDCKTTQTEQHGGMCEKKLYTK